MRYYVLPERDLLQNAHIKPNKLYNHYTSGLYWNMQYSCAG